MHRVILFSFLLLVQTIHAQQFINAGKLTFERKVAQFTLMENLYENGGADNIWITEMKKVFPKIVTDYYTLEFNNNSTLFKVEKENLDNKYMLDGLKPSDQNYVYQDLSQGLTTMTKGIFENLYIVKDSIKQFQWKITGEVRDIAGFECKKALAKINDSVVVVAFYTDQILVKGGPENFNGLPGMILGLAVPRLALTLFATKLELGNPNLIPKLPTKPKYVKYGQITQDVEKGLKTWGKEGKAIAWLLNL
jgi:GLPGLI family protein